MIEQLALSFDLVDFDVELGDAGDGFNVCEDCGDPLITIVDVWPVLREFSVLVCCPEGEALIEYEGGFAELPRRYWTRLFAEEVGLDVRGVAKGSLDVAIDWGLDVRQLDRLTAHAFIAEHHEHNDAPLGERLALGAWNGPDLVAVATIGRPVARHNQRRDAEGRDEVLEVTRLASRRDLDRPALRWNASSQLYGAAARWARRQGAERVITYTLESESGESLTAAGFARLYLTRPERRGWDRPGRAREAEKTPSGRKWVWERRLRKGLGPLNKRAARWAAKLAA